MWTAPTNFDFTKYTITPKHHKHTFKFWLKIANCEYVGSYGVVFKAIRNEKKLLNPNMPLTGMGDTAESHNNYHNGQKYAYAEHSTDVDANGNIRKYAIKRIFPTINAAFILIEMLILKYLK